MGAGVTTAIILALALRKAGTVAIEAAGDAAHAINPTNNDNIINRGFTSVYQTITGSDDTLGGDIYDITHDMDSALAYLKTLTPVGGAKWTWNRLFGEQE